MPAPRVPRFLNGGCVFWPCTPKMQRKFTKIMTFHTQLQSHSLSAIHRLPTLVWASNVKKCRKIYSNYVGHVMKCAGHVKKC